MQKLYAWMQSQFAALRSEEGQTMAEYGVVLALITLIVVGAFTGLGGAIVNKITQVTGILGA